jgi:chitinase
LIGTATLTPNPAWPYIPPATPTPKIEDDDEFLVEPLPTFEDGDDDDTEWPVGLVEPVTDKDKSPPPNGSRVSCKTWFFFICIDWPELNIKVDFWDIVLPPGKIGPGPPPIHLLKLPTGWRVGCLELHCLPPWPEVT